MLRDTLIGMLLSRAGNRTNDAVLRAALETELLAVQTFYEGGTWMPWWLVTKTDVLTLTTGNDTILLPTNFLRELEEDSRLGALFRYDATQTDPWVCLTKDTYDDIKKLYPGSGPTVAYDILGDSLIVCPVADTAYTYRLRYFGEDAVLSTNIENKWLKNADGLFRAKLGSVMARYYLHNPDMAAMYMGDEKEEYDELVNAETARREAARMRDMGAD